MRRHAQKAPHCFHAVLSLHSLEVETLGDCSVSSIVCSHGVTPYGKRDSRQGMGCDKVVLKCLRKAGTVMWVSRDAKSASMLSTPEMQDMDAWICA